MIKTAIWTPFAVFSIMTGFIIVGAINIEDPVVELRSNDPNDREKAVRKILEERQRIVKDLEGIVKEMKNNDARGASVKAGIMLLGGVHAVESIPLLVDNLTFIYTESKSIRYPDFYRPCIKALIAIGYPATDHLFKKIEEGDDEDMMSCTAFTLKRMLGKNVAAFCIQNRAQRQDDSAKRARLVTLQRYLDKWSELDKQ